MRNAVAALLALSLAAQAALAEPADAGAHALSGVWWMRNHPPRLLPADGKPLPLTPEGRTRYEKIVAGLKAGDILDEATHLCLPEGMPRAMTSAYPFQIIMTPGQITFAHEANRAYRMVGLDVQHADPKTWDPSYMGDGVGHWDGDTLVIDSTNFKANKIYLDSSGLPASEQLHLIEHLKLVDRGRKLEDLITIDDPVIFTKQWTARLIFSRRDDIQLKTDWVCGEKHRDVSAAAMSARGGGSPAAASAATSARAAGSAAAAGSALTGASQTGASHLSAGQLALNGYWGTWKRFMATMGPGHPPVQTESKDFLLAAGKLQPWARAKYDSAVAADAAGQFVPSNTTSCYPDWIAGSGIFDAYSMEILIEPRQVSFLAEAGRAMRFVYIDQSHPASLQPSWTGHSVGHWEGDTLVIDTLGFNDRSSLPFRVPMTSKMHVVERLHVTDGVLEDQAIFDDPGAFTEPFTVTTQFDRSKPYQEYICAENNHEGGVPTADGGTTKSDLPKDRAP